MLPRSPPQIPCRWRTRRKDTPLADGLRREHRARDPYHSGDTSVSVAGWSAEWVRRTDRGGRSGRSCRERTIALDTSSHTSGTQSCLTSKSSPFSAASRVAMFLGDAFKVGSSWTLGPDRARLAAIVVNRKAQKHVWRAWIVLLTADGLDTGRSCGRPARSSRWSGAGRSGSCRPACTACCATRRGRRASRLG